MECPLLSAPITLFLEDLEDMENEDTQLSVDGHLVKANTISLHECIEMFEEHTHEPLPIGHPGHPHGHGNDPLAA